MSGAELLHWASLAALVIVGLAMLLATVRIIIGPTLADRILALDLLTVATLGFVAAFAVHSGRPIYLDIAVALALLGFLATLAFTRYLLARGGNQ